MSKVFAQPIEKPTIDELISFLTEIKKHCDDIGKVGVVDCIDHFNCENLCISDAVVVEFQNTLEITLHTAVKKI